MLKLLLYSLILLFVTYGPVYAADEVINKSAEQLAKYYLTMAQQSQAYADRYKALAKQYEAKVKGKNTEDAIKNNKPFEGTNAGLGIIANTGNNNTTNLNANLFWSYVPNKLWNTTWKTDYQYAADAGTPTTNRFISVFNSIRNLDETNGVYGYADYTRDLFGGYTYVATQSIGYNRVITNNKIWSLSVQIGPGYMWREIISPPQTQSFVTLYNAFNSTVHINDKTTWQENVSARYSLHGIFYTFDSSIVGQIYQNFGLKGEVEILYDTQAPDNANQLNTLTTLSLIYNL